MYGEKSVQVKTTFAEIPDSSLVKVEKTLVCNIYSES